MLLDSRWLQIFKDADIQLAIFLCCLVLWVVGHFGGLATLEWLLPWVKVGLVVSGCFLFVSCIAAFLRARL